MSDQTYDEMVTQSHEDRLAQVRGHVAEGAAWLDGFKPGWWRLINTSPQVFKLESGLTCVWGQLAAVDLEEWFGPVVGRDMRYDYTHCYLELGRRGMIPRDDTRPGWMETHGFVTRQDNLYGVLREAWVQAIAQRQQQAEESA